MTKDIIRDEKDETTIKILRLFFKISKPES